MMQSCYSNFTIKEFIDQNLLKGKDISKIKLKDGREIFMTEATEWNFSNRIVCLLKVPTEQKDDSF
jgi:hypothetical protein